MRIMILAAALLAAAPSFLRAEGCRYPSLARQEQSTHDAAENAVSVYQMPPSQAQRDVNAVTLPCDPRTVDNYGDRIKGPGDWMAANATTDARREAFEGVRESAAGTDWGKSAEGRQVIAGWGKQADQAVYAAYKTRAADEIAQHNYPQAQEDAQRAQADAARFRGPDPSLDSIRAQAYLGVGDYPAAEAAATRALDLDSSLQPAWSTRAAARMGLGNAAGAQSDAQKALALNPADPRAQGLLRASSDKLSGPLQASAHAAPSSLIPARPGLSEAALPEGSGIAAAPGAGAAAEPAPPGGLAGVALAKLQIGDAKGALETADRAVAQNPGSPEAWLVRANARNLTGDFTGALADAERAAALQPSAEAHNARAWALHGLGRNAEALQAAQSAVSASPRGALGYLNRARALEALGRRPDALTDYKRAAALNPQFKKALEEAYARAALPGGAPAAPSRQRGGFSRWALAALAAAPFLLALAAWRLRAGPATTGGSWTEGRTGPSSTGMAPSAGKYALEREIGRGGMGVVYLGRDTVLDRPVAVKRMRSELSASSAERRRFMQEARLVAALQHPSIVSIYDVFEDGDAYLVFEFVQGETLEALLERRGKLPLKDCKRILAPVCEALSYAHARRVIHRDLKPSNIMLSSDGRVRVMDFGIAREAKDTVSRLTAAGAVGTPAYMPPEQERGEARRESDLYALGACLYQMAAGRPPFQSGNFTLQKMEQAYPAPSRLNPELPAQFDAFIAKALAPDPAGRFSSPEEFLRTLQDIPETAARA